MKTLENIEKLAVDSNPILSSVIGGRAKDIFIETENILFYTTHQNFLEVCNYIPVLANEKNLSAGNLFLILRLLPLKVLEETEYKNKIKEAARLISDRDPKDIPILALALTLKCPIWTNDKDFEDTDVLLYKTHQLLDMLKEQRK